MSAPVMVTARSGGIAVRDRDSFHITAFTPTLLLVFGNLARPTPTAKILATGSQAKISGLEFKMGR